MKPGNLVSYIFEHDDFAYECFCFNKPYDPMFSISKNTISIILEIGDQFQCPGIKIFTLNGIGWVNSNYFKMIE